MEQIKNMHCQLKISEEIYQIEACNLSELNLKKNNSDTNSREKSRNSYEIKE